MKTADRLLSHVKAFCRYNLWSIISYCALASCYFFALEVFNSQLNVDGINYASTHLRRLADAALFALPVLFMRKRVPVCIYSVIPILYFISNIWYYRTYFSLMPLSSYTMWGNLDGLSDSIVNSMRRIDLVMVSPTLLFVVFYAVLGVKVRKRTFLTRMELLILPLLFIDMLEVPSYLFHAKTEYSHPYILFQNEPMRAYRQFGFMNYWLYTHYKSHPVDESQKLYVREFMNSFSSKNHDIENLVENNGNNLILILCESLQSWPVDLVVDGSPVMPYLHNLVRHDTSVIYLPEVLPQVKDGRSSDAQLLINTGLLPIEIGATSSLFGTNPFPGLPKALKERGYTSVNMLCDNSLYWNQAATSRSYGFDKVIDHMKGENPLIRSDERLFRCGLDSIMDIAQPFYLQMVTLSGHDAIDMGRPSRFNGMKEIPEKARYNLVICEYVDSCIGSFLEGLKARSIYDKSTVMITGDHHAVTFNIFEDREKCLLSDCYIPLIIINSPIEYDGTERVVGQSDIYPTILDMTGVSDYYFRGFGHSIFRQHPGGAVFPDGRAIGVTTPEAKDSLVNLWRISDILIRSNYFATDHK